MTGKELTKLRESKGLTRQNVADLLGTDRKTQWRWESGATKIPGPAQVALQWLLRPTGAPRGGTHAEA